MKTIIDDNFLSMDLIERLIKVEMHVSKSFNCPVTMEETEYYRSLSPQKQKEFQEYLKSKKAKKLVAISSLILPLFALGLFNATSVGNVVRDNFGESLVSVEIILGIVVLTVLIFIGISFLNSKFSNKNVYKHLKLLVPIIEKRKVRQKFKI